jgi:hypothetical protein
MGSEESRTAGVLCVCLLELAGRRTRWNAGIFKVALVVGRRVREIKKYDWSLLA